MPVFVLKELNCQLHRNKFLFPVRRIRRSERYLHEVPASAADISLSYSEIDDDDARSCAALIP